MQRDQAVKEVKNEVQRFVARAKALGINETKLAEKIGVSRMAILRWKTGANVPSAVMFKKLQQVVEAEEAVFG